MRLDHVVIRAYDAQATLDFYGGLLGLPRIAAHEGEDWGGFDWLMMIFGLQDGREIVLVVLRGAQPPDETRLPADSRHYALAVDTLAEQASWRERLQAAGHDFWEEDHGGQHSLYFADPSGVILEITTPPTGAGTTPSEDAMATVKHWMGR
jgi:catechol 2,3-dioxygenase-like lactoylglutathione lyase family enzyme